MAQTPLQPNYMKVFIQRDYSEGELTKLKIRKYFFLQFNSRKIIRLPNYILFSFFSGTSVKFQTRFPTELESRIDRHSFEATINKLNEFFVEAEKGNCSTFCEGAFACFSAYLIYLFTETHYEKVL